MRKISTAVVLAAALALILAFSASAITGGQPDGGNHPNVGAMLIVEPDRVRLVCSGTLVAPTVFLSAGHCTDFLEFLIEAGRITADDVYVSFDSDDALSAERIPIAEDGIHTHPDYAWTPQSNPHDIGILILAEEPDIEPGVLPEENLLDELLAAGRLKKGSERAQFAAVGYGTTLEWPPPIIIPVDGVRRASQPEFLNLQKAWVNMSQNQAPGRGDSGTCYGDSGGPNFWTNDDGSEVIVAVTSTGDAQCVATNKAYRVDIPESLSFINSVIDSVQ